MLSMVLVVGLAMVAVAVVTEGGYGVVVSKATLNDSRWKAVVDALVAKHEAQVIVFEKSVEDALPELRRHVSLGQGSTGNRFSGRLQWYLG